ncbi:chondroitinase-B domain-containing protein [Botrimarina sp.]|uniref:chondroitinase-B domain-containing protein n=1 Tax=Botrimarina sp. TaxID=2795802 RepID=UPI0032EF4D8D
MPRGPAAAALRVALCAALWAGVALVSAAAARGAEFLVTSAADVSAAMSSAQPGDTLVMANGVWTDQRIDFAGDGAPGAPITLRPQTPGGVVLTGRSTLSISGDSLVADGLRFEGGALSGGHVVEFRGSRGPATNSRLTNSAIASYNPADIGTRYFWVSLYGQSNRVDHNRFTGQAHSGVTVTVWRDADTPDFHQIDHNYFGDRPEGNGNGFETIRIGTSDRSLSDSHTVVENNLFERVDGEIEIISNKSGANAFRYNTFRESAGTLTLRHGDGNLVEGNFFLGQGKDGSGGVRVIGERQTLVNNYFSNLDDRADGAISITAGVPDSPLSGYYQVRDALVAHNTVVGVRGAAVALSSGLGSSGRTLTAQNVTLANNLFWSNQSPLFEGQQGDGWLWEGNLAFGQSLGPLAGEPGVTVADPQMVVGSDGLFRLSPDSPAVDAAASGYTHVAPIDFDGQPRIGLSDIGADELSDAVMVRKPLEERDVGPDWFARPEPGGRGCGPGGCALQAEAYDQLLDPDGNGAVWSVVATPDALGGLAIRAPGGDRVDLPAEPHDAIAAYEVELSVAGEYTAYYRARGFDSSSDSLFAPSTLGVDPDQNLGLSDDGRFGWRRGASAFAIGEAHLGVPLELRIGMREHDAELDAIVLSLDAALTDAELDALFAPLAGDFNADGAVDAADYPVWRDTLGQTGPGLAADADADGSVDPDDYGVWLTAYGGAARRPGATAPEPAALPLGATLLAALCPLSRSRRAPR